ncbi:MAG: Lipoprotein [Actinomycetia bacterium]|nr:Lipoprotein [Actinomycetes bacterium]
MGWTRRLVVVLALVGLVVLVAAPGSEAKAKKKPKPKPTTTTTVPPASAPAVATAAVGKLGTLLVDAKGATLYRYTPESDGKVACTGGCAAAWPPLLKSGTATPTLAKGVAGKLGTVQRPDKSVQLTYNGIPLYRYAADTKKGVANGQGAGGVWYIVKPGDTPGSTPFGATTTTTVTPSTSAPGGANDIVPDYGY